MADRRVVSVQLRADIGNYQSSMAKAAASTRALGDSATQSSREVGRASDDAARKVSEVRRQLVELGRTKVSAGVAVDTVAARMELNQLQAELAEIDRSDASAQVDAETAAAEAQIRSLQSQLNRIDGQTVTARVNVDDGGSAIRATAHLNGLWSAALAVSPALGAIGGVAAAGIGVIAPLAATAAGGLGVLMLGFSGLGDAVELLEKQGEASGAALEKVNAKLAEVNPATLTFARYVQDTLAPALKDVQGTAAAGLLPGVQAALENMLPHLGSVNDFVGRLSGRFGELAVEGSRALTSPMWMDFWRMIDENADPIMTDFFHTLLNIGTGFAGMSTAFMPMARDVSAGIVDLTGKFATWGAELGESEGFRRFQQYVSENWPKVRDIIANVAETIGTMIEAGAPIGAAYLDAFVALSNVLASLPVGVVQALLVAFIGFRGVSAVAGIINSVAASFDMVQIAAGRVTGALGAAESGMGRFGTAASGVVNMMGGPWGVALGAAGIVIGGIATDMANASATTDRWAQALLAGGSAAERVRLEAERQREQQPFEWMADLDEFMGFAPSMDEATRAARALWNEMTPLQQAQSKVAEWSGILNQRLNDENATTEQVRIAKERYAYWTGEESRMQGELQAATVVSNSVLGAQALTYQDLSGAAATQLGIYRTVLQERAQAETDSAAHTGAKTGEASGAWQSHVSSVGVSLDEYARRLEEDTQNKENWRANIVAVTARGGSEVGQILLAMGEEGAQIAADMANATDSEFHRMQRAMIDNARVGGQGAAGEMDLYMRIMAEKARQGGANTVSGMAQALGVGVGEVARIASQYGVSLAGGINPVLKGLGKTPITIQTAPQQIFNGQVPVRRAEGGPIPGFSPHPKADNVPVMATAGEFMQPVSTVQYYGTGLMEALRKRKIPREALHLAEGGLVAFGRRLQSMGAKVTEHPLFGGVGQHGKNSLHYSGNAIDVNTRPGTSALEQRELGPMASLARSLGFRTIFMSAGHFNHLHVDTGRGGSIGAAGGGVPAVELPKPPGLAPFAFPIADPAAAIMQHAYDQANQWMLANTMAESAAGGPPGAGVERWRGTVMQALARVGQSGSLANTTLRRMNQESGGNPRAINNWDVNAKRGPPSKGLMQVIDPTFATHRDRGLVNNIWDPMANIVASMRYALSRYGSLSSAYNRKGGYDQGGVAEGLGFMAKNTISPERVLSPRQTAAFEQMVTREFGANSFGGGIDYNKLAAAIAATGRGALVGEYHSHFHGDNNEHKAVEELAHTLQVTDLGGRYSGAGL
ncbi:transglycosylase SLT domain-containing protein [Geodermatophilus sp. DSM 45219]|uniref:transglycosylase SLT domain-containing protein n=1 Tax=Geodermatophilus sp. DSM 45219 TaxID=1881103 RepID=UPI00088A3821|nr:transglycosylase SLT domain-containing protein [Geodermatophilus sp. DSM 45219]SDN79029.1 Transglycosylase SLT domain-containing protein [Geodermatophilus sp. DSM 45219]